MDDERFLVFGFEGTSSKKVLAISIVKDYN